MKYRTDRTPLLCLVIVTIACLVIVPATLAVPGPIIDTQSDSPIPKQCPRRAPVTVSSLVWEVACFFTPHAPWCPGKVKDPPMPSPRELGPEGPPCDIYGPCQ